jgi:hypothetical protein
MQRGYSGQRINGSPLLWNCRRDWLDDAGLQVGRGDLDAGAENTEYIVGRPRLYVNRRVGTANRLVRNQTTLFY